MENKTEVNNTPSKIPEKYRWFAGYIVAGIIYAIAIKIDPNKTPHDEVIIAVVAILCGCFYHKLKSRIKIEGEVRRTIVTFIILEIIAGSLIGFLTALF
jgi:hypothetical protein